MSMYRSGKIQTKLIVYVPGAEMILGWECGSRVDIALSILLEIFTWILHKHTHTQINIQHSWEMTETRTL